MFRPAVKTFLKRLSKSYYIARFKLVEIAGFNPRPFQFVNIWVPGVDEIPMSISDFHEGSGELTILFKVVGEGTRTIKDREGFFGVKGPIGRGFDINADRVLFVAGGTGIAPLPFFAREAERAGARVDVLWGLRTVEDLFDIKSIAPMVREVMIATEDCSIGFCGTAAEALSRLQVQGMYDVVIAVGPKLMLRSICNSFNSVEGIYVALETLVKCGMGACGSCTVSPSHLLLCKDGPVFECKEVRNHLDRP